MSSSLSGLSVGLSPVKLSVDKLFLHNCQNAPDWPFKTKQKQTCPMQLGKAIYPINQIDPKEMSDRVNISTDTCAEKLALLLTAGDPGKAHF